MNRRHFLGASLGSLALAACRPAVTLAQTCGPRTDPNIEGPFFLPGAPERAALTDEPTLILSGAVRDPGCRPLRDAVLEVWQADADGEYDTRGDRFRGIVRTDAQGRWRIATIRPGRYRLRSTFRPAHIHVKVHATGRPPLTTQLYFPGDPFNERDPWFRESLRVWLLPPGCGGGQRPQEGGFDFVV